MPHSYAETLTLTCAACDRDFDAEFWLVVDAVERPDLLARIRAGTLHDLACPHCGDAGHMDAPLLLFRPDDEPVLFFSPAGETAADEDQEQAEQLVELLRDTLGDDWQDDWLAEGLRSAPRTLLPALLSDDPEAAMAQMAEQAEPQLPPELLKILAERAASGVEVRSTEDLEAVLASQPDLRAGWEAMQQAEIVATMNDTSSEFLRRYWSTGNPTDLQRALEIWQSALQRTLPNSPLFSSLLNNLGTGLRARFDYSGDPADLDEAIAHIEQGVEHTPPVSPDFPRHLNNLGNNLLARYNRLGHLSDLEETIRVYQRAVQYSPPDSLADLSMVLNNLGTALYDLYQSTGHPINLDEAIASWEQAVKGTPPGSLELPRNLSNLGVGLRARYMRTGQLADLDEAIRLFRSAVQHTPPDSPSMPMYLSSLGNGLQNRYARSADPVDLANAIEAFEQSVRATPTHSPNLPVYLNNLGNGLRDRYAHTGQLNDLEETISVYKDSVDRTLPESPSRSRHLNNLGSSLHDRYARIHRLEDLEEAIRCTQTAVEHTPPGSPESPMFLNNLGNGLHDRYARTGALADLAEARERYRIACQRGIEVTPEGALRSARNWGNWALQRRAWQEATEAYAYGRQAIDLLFATQTSRAAKESWLKEAQGLPANAAYALARLDRLEEAIVTLEAGRARLLAEALEQNRRDLAQLEPLGHKAVLDRYRAVSQRVAALQQQANQPATQSLWDRSQSPNHPVTQFDYTAWRQQLEQAQADLQHAIAAIRQVPGYQDFFLPPTFEKIQQAATPDAPLVYLATTPVGSVALVVRAEQTLRVSANHDSPANNDSPANHDQTRRVSVVWLDGFSEADLGALLVERQDGQVTGGYLPGQLGDYDALHASLAQVLPRLGQALMGPLAAHLAPSPSEGEGRGAGENPPRSVVLIPAGHLSLLPLHAARYTVDGQERCLLDAFSVRYAPSAAALATAHSEAQRRHAPLRLAGVGNPLPDLATGAWASQRAQAILQRLPTAPAGEALDLARQTLHAVAAAAPQEAIRAGDLLLPALRDLVLGGAAQDLVLATLEIAQRIPPSLDYAEAELHSVLDLLPGDGTWTAFGEQATAAALWQALPAATWLHLACHGQFDPEEPLQSALLLGAGTRLTLRELLERGQGAALAGLRLAFLSACQTAIADFRKVPDEAVGLPAAFLQAGIPAVVGTLWPVNDASTALLATRFYEMHLHGDPAAGLAPQPPAAALQGAQRWLRDVTNAELGAYLDGHRRLKEASVQEQPRMSWALIADARREVRRALRAGQDDVRPYESAYHWAPFVFYGAG